MQYGYLSPISQIMKFYLRIAKKETPKGPFRRGHTVD